MEYTSPSYSNNTPVDGIILQAPVADREALGMDMGQDALDESVKEAKNMIASGKGFDRMPVDHVPDEFDTPISASRWYALTAPE
jgi:hypothetical protein